MLLIKGKNVAVWGLAAAVLVFGLGLLAGYKLFKPMPKEAAPVTAQAILTALHDRGFLISQTYIFDTPVTIEKSAGSPLKDFFFGQTIEARGTMEVNLGIDLAEVREEDVTIDEAANTITIRIPKARLFNTRLVGPIDLKNNEGILKRLFNTDDGYNEALGALTKASEATAMRPEILGRATERGKEDIARLLSYVARPPLTVSVVVEE